MIEFKDFVPEISTSGKFLNKTTNIASFRDTLAAANDWVKENNITPTNVETVVLPNIYCKDEEGSEDTDLNVDVDDTSTWHQVIRIWYNH